MSDFVSGRTICNKCFKLQERITNNFYLRGRICNTCLSKQRSTDQRRRPICINSCGAQRNFATIPNNGSRVVMPGGCDALDGTSTTDGWQIFEARRARPPSARPPSARPPSAGPTSAIEEISSLRISSDIEDVICEICINEYNENDCAPRVLNCGHTMCSPCLKQILQSTVCCPKCLKRLSSRNLEDFPMNLSLLRLVNTLKSSLLLHEFSQQRINVLKAKHKRMVDRFNENKSNVEAGITRLESLSGNGAVINRVNENISSLNRQLGDLQNIKILKAFLLKDSVTYRFGDFDDPVKYIKEIYNRIGNGEQLYAITKIEDEIKYSRISVWNNKLLVHAFGSQTEEQNPKTVWFQDLKLSMKSLKFGAFLELSCNAFGRKQIVLIQPLDCCLVPQFLKLCTGEMGPVYKGSVYHRGTPDCNWARSIITIDKLILRTAETAGIFEYSSVQMKNSFNVFANDLMVTGSSDGDLKILLVTKNGTYQNILGYIEDPLNLPQLLTYGKENYVVDSGLVITIF